MRVRPRQRAAQVVRRVARVSPPWLTAPAARAVRPLRRGRGPLVSVVLTVSDEETTKVGPAVTSLLQQRHANLDIIVVPWGRCERATAVVRTQAASDNRVRILRKVEADLSSARNRGAQRARGTYLCFLDGGDDLLPRGIERLVRLLEGSGSAFAVGTLTEPAGAVVASTTAPHEAAHDRDRPGTTLRKTPMAITDLTLGNRLFRRAFWKAAGLRFTQATDSATTLSLAAYSAADRFDLSRHATYVRSARRNAALGTLPDLLSTLEDWIREQRTAWATVEALGVAAVSDAWLWGILDTAIQPFIDDVERAGDRDWVTLRETVELLLRNSGADAWASLRAESRVRLWLLREGKRDQLEQYVAARWFERGNRRTRVEDGRVLAELPFFRDPAVAIPDETFEMREAETPLQVILTGVRWVDATRVELDLLARARFVGMAEHPRVSVDLVRHRSRSGKEGRVPLDVRQRQDPLANQLLVDKYQDYSRGALTVTVDAEALVQATGDLPSTQGQGVDWEFEVSLETQGVRRTGQVEHLDDRGSAGMLGMGHLGARSVAGARVATVAGTHTRVALRVLPGLPVRLTEATVAGRTVSGVIDRDGGVQQVRASMGPLACEAPVVDGSFTLTLPPPSIRGGAWTLSVVGADVASSPIAWPHLEHWTCIGSGEVVPTRSVDGAVELREAADTLVLESLEMSENGLHIAASWLGRPPERLTLSLSGPRLTIEAEDVVVDDGRLSARFATTWDEWGLGRVPVPVGRYWFTLTAGPADAPRPGRVLLSTGMLDNLLEFRLTGDFRFRAIRLGRDAGVHLTAPVPDSCRGGFNRQRLVDWANSEEPAIEPDWVYFQSYTGASATDSQLAIFHEVRRRHPELVCWWGVANLSSRVPEGARPVVISSEEWFRVLASSRRLVMNIDLDRWFSPRPGQEFLQTFHGYPAKSMGIGLWEAKSYTPRRIDAELARTSADWDLILTPAPEMDEHYRREYRYDGPIHSAGYPRDDVLVSPEADRVREETRERLGIGSGQKAVLYAPTWRDDQATNWRSAELTRHLDLEAASARLGPDYVFLMRGHRFHARAGERSESTARLLDVTDYPEINDLILASDAAVLDYSSLRFDFALTGRPMLFLVPDLADYVRGFLYDFEESAPGPLLDSADEVIAHLRDLPALQAEYADQIARFNKTYNYLQDGKAAERVVTAFFG